MRRLLIIHHVCPFSMKWCVQSPLNLRQSSHNYSSSHSFLRLLVLGVLCGSEKEFEPSHLEMGGGVGVDVDLEVFVLTMLDEAANCPQPREAELHDQFSISLSASWWLFFHS